MNREDAQRKQNNPQNKKDIDISPSSWNNINYVGSIWDNFPSEKRNE